MNYLICYDIRKDKPRKKIAKKLEDWGIRVQYSFFQCELDKEELTKLVKSLLDLMNKEEDFLFVYPICQNCLENTLTSGTGQLEIQTSFDII